MYTSEEHGQFTHILDDAHQVMVVLVHASKRSTDQIVTALNAWQEIQQAYMQAQMWSGRVAEAHVYLAVEAEMAVIPKNVHSARERLKQSGEEGADCPWICPQCGDDVFLCYCGW